MTELNESITTVKKKKKPRVVEGEVVREIWKKLDMNGGRHNRISLHSIQSFNKTCY